MEPQSISKSARTRLPGYLTFLKSLPAGSPANISATAIAAALGMGDVQVRKDLAAVSGAGKPKIGYLVSDLIEDLEQFLGYHNDHCAVVVGCGKLGRALLDYKGFGEYGLELSAGFDTVCTRPETAAGGREIFPMGALPDYCREKNVHLAVLAVPASGAQAACDALVSAGIRAILNFAPTHLRAPQDVLIKNENIAVSLAALSSALQEKTGGRE